MDVVSKPFELVVYSSNLSIDSVLVPLEFLLCRVNSDPSPSKCWPSID